MASRAAKKTNWRMVGQMVATGVVVGVGGPALCYWVTPTEEQLFLKYNPELQKRSLESRYQKQEDFDNFVMRLREYSKSDKPIWEAAEEAEQKSRINKHAEQRKLVHDIEARKEEIRAAGIKPVPGGSWS